MLLFREVNDMVQIIRCEWLDFPLHTYEREKLRFTKGFENIQFEIYAREQPKREQALSAWDFLRKMYAHYSLFAIQTLPKLAISQERKRLMDEDKFFLAALPKKS
jgi:hypothetical protein